MPINPLKNRKLPRIKRQKKMTTAALKKEIAARSSLSAGDVLSTMEELKAIIIENLQKGGSVETPLGTFLPSIRLDGTKRIQFIPKKELRRAVDGGFTGEIINRQSVGLNYDQL